MMESRLIPKKSSTSSIQEFQSKSKPLLLAATLLTSTSNTLLLTDGVRSMDTEMLSALMVPEVVKSTSSSVASASQSMDGS